MLEDHDIQPLSDLADQVNARASAIEQLEHGTLLESEVTDLAVYLLGALAQIEALTLRVDPMAARFNAAGHPYPALVREGLGDAWTGPGRNDFDGPLVEAVLQYLKRHKGPSADVMRGDAINAIRNKCLAEDFGWIEQRMDERGSAEAGVPKVRGQGGTQMQQARSEVRALHEIPEGDRGSTLAAINAARPRLTHPQPPKRGASHD
ncbi:MAG: hypothetical protein ACFB0C_15530 [Leptolyngbyaceae cyanobacterium]